MDEREALTEIRVNVAKIAQQLTAIEKRLVDGEKRFDELQAEVNQLWDKYNWINAEYSKLKGILLTVGTIYGIVVTYLNLIK